MRHSKHFFGLLVLSTSCAFAVACGDDDNTNPVVQDGGQPDTFTPVQDGSPTTDAEPDANTGPVFLDSSAYSDLFTIDASFAFGVTARHAADGTIGSGVAWGTTGPIVTGFPTVTSWTLPTDPKGAATSAMVTAATPTDLPDPGPMKGPFFGSFASLPFGSLALQSYTISDANFSGEALLFGAGFTTVASRAKTNGFYAGVGVTDGTTDAIVYSGLSVLATTAPAGQDNGLYAAPLCAGQLLPTGSCAASHKLFGWTGSSGPVAADVNGNVFVAASLGATGELDGVTKAQALATGAATQVTLGTDASLGGTGSLTAISTKGAANGWLVAIGFPDFTTGAVPKVFAADYTSGASGLAKGTHPFASVITPATAVTGIALFSDNDGNLWLAVTTATTGAFVELQAKP